MSVRHIDTTRTTSLPVMDMADAIEMWGNELSIKNSDQVDQWRETTPQQEVPPPPLKAGERLSAPPHATRDANRADLRGSP